MKLILLQKLVDMYTFIRKQIEDFFLTCYTFIKEKTIQIVVEKHLYTLLYRCFLLSK